MKVVIVCGGRGTRLWPVSRIAKPKPFIPLINGKSLLQITYERFRIDYKPSEIFISTEEPYLKYVKKQVDVPRQNIILEPERKDILAAIGLATAVVNKYYPGEPVLMSWAKHFIAKERVFLDAVKAAGKYAEKTNLIVSIDSKPPFAGVYWGWVKTGKTLGSIDGYKLKQIVKHVEKPEQNVADKLYKDGKWLINTGYRVWKTDQMLNYYKKYQPSMYKGLQLITDAWGTKDHEKVLKREYHKFVKESIEYGIFEKLPGDVRATIPADMGWEDVGISWELFYESLITPKRKTVIEGGADVTSVDSKDNLVVGPKGKMIALIDMEGVMVIDTKDGLVVGKLNKSHKVKDLYKKLEHYNKKYVE